MDPGENINTGRNANEDVKSNGFSITGPDNTITPFDNSLLSLLKPRFLCNICNDTISQACLLECTHTFCKACILQWFLRKDYCPVCREKIISITRWTVLDDIVTTVQEETHDIEPFRRTLRRSSV